MRRASTPSCAAPVAGSKRIARLMRQAQLRGRTQAVEDHHRRPGRGVRADLVRRDFGTNAAAATRALVRGLYVPTWEGWLYLPP